MEEVKCKEKMEEVVKKKKRFIVAVHYLRGMLSLEVERKSLGAALFQTVCRCLDIRSSRFFGLQYEDAKGRAAWLRKDRRVLAQVGRDRGLYLLVRYYPDSAAEVAEGGDAELVFLQAREAVLSGAVYCPPELSLLLASYGLQAEYGDRPPFELLTAARLVPREARLARPVSEAAWVRAVRSWHLDHRGMAPRAALLEYLRLVATLSMYAVSYFPVRWMGSAAHLGVAPSGLNLYYDSNLVTPKVRLGWPAIKYLRCSCGKLTVRPSLPSEPEYVFRVATSRRLAQIYSMSVGYFRLYRRRRFSPPPPSHPISAQTNAYETISSDNSSKERLPTVEEQEEVPTQRELLIR